MPMVRRRGKRFIRRRGNGALRRVHGCLCRGAALRHCGVRKDALAVKASQRAARSSGAIGVAKTWRVRTSSVPSNWRVSPYSREIADARRASRLASGRPPRGRFRALRQLSIRRRQASPGVNAVTLNWRAGREAREHDDSAIDCPWVHGVTPSSPEERDRPDEFCCAAGVSRP